MSEFKGTKGKWELKVQNKFPFSYDIETENGGQGVLFGICHYSTSDKNIDDCLKRDFKNNSESLANAKLIACAPEMLEMLERLECWCANVNEDAIIVKDIKQLIKKATS